MKAEIKRKHENRSSQALELRKKVKKQRALEEKQRIEEQEMRQYEMEEREKQIYKMKRAQMKALQKKAQETDNRIHHTIQESRRKQEMF